MARKLKTFVTDSGFFQLAVAAPSMKAALEAWGIKVNLFQQGLARQTDNPAIVAAAQNAPGQVLRRPLGSKGAFRANAELPKVKGASRTGRKTKAREADPKALHAALHKLEQAEARHRKRLTMLERARDALEVRAGKEEQEWRREKEKLERRVGRLKDGGRVT